MKPLALALLLLAAGHYLTAHWLRMGIDWEAVTFGEQDTADDVDRWLRARARV